jgi:hypothetical protein
VLFFDSNKNFHAHPNKEIGNGGHFLSMLDLKFSVQFISELKFLLPNGPLYEISIVPSVLKKKKLMLLLVYAHCFYMCAFTILILFRKISI